MAAISTGQITIMDLTDERVISFYLKANKAKTQVRSATKDSDGNVSYSYEPHFTSQDPIEITPVLLFGSSDCSNLLQDEGVLSYTLGTTLASSIQDDSVNITAYKTLQIARNLGDDDEGLFSGSSLLITAEIPKGKITDPKTKLTNSAPVTATFDLSRIDHGLAGDNGASVLEVNQIYLLNEPGTNGEPVTPTKPSDDSAEISPWQNSPPAWNNTQYLWLSSQIVYSDGRYRYTTPYTDSTWKEAVKAVNTLSTQIDSLQSQIDGAIDTWYRSGTPTANGFLNPWLTGTETDPEKLLLNQKHVGDLYLDTDTNKAYRFYGTDTNGDSKYEEFYWSEIQGDELSDLLKQISDIQTEVDGKVSVFYGDIKDTDQPSEGDLRIANDGNIYSYTNGRWVEKSFAVRQMRVEFGSSDSPTTEPTSWSTNQPSWDDDTNPYVWQRIAYWTSQSADPDTTPPDDHSPAVCISAAGAKGIIITGEQALISNDGTNFSGPNTLTAITTGGLTVDCWKYKTATTPQTVANSAGKSTISVGADHAAFNGGNTATFYVYANNNKYYDTITLYKLTNGQDGTPATTLFAGNENIVISADANGKTSSVAQVFDIPIYYYNGTKRMPVRFDTNAATGVSGLGFSWSGNNTEDPRVQVRAAQSTVIGGATIAGGTIKIPLLSPAAELTISWSKVNAGAAGASAITAKVAPQDGRLIFSDEDPGDIVLQGTKLGTTTVPTRYYWKAVPAWTSEELATLDLASDGGSASATLTIPRSMVVGARSISFSFKINSVPYEDIITIQDKKDPLWVSIYSTHGDKFTNGVIETTLVCQLFNNYGEVDTLTDHSKNGHQCKYEYVWTRYIDGNLDTTWDPKYGKTIPITSGDVSVKAMFNCEVTEKTNASNVQEG